jgi:hypothetical protein
MIVTFLVNTAPSNPAQPPMYSRGSEEGEVSGQQDEATDVEFSVDEDAHRVHKRGNYGGSGEAHCLRRLGII